MTYVGNFLKANKCYLFKSPIELIFWLLHTIATATNSLIFTCMKFFPLTVQDLEELYSTNNDLQLPSLIRVETQNPPMLQSIRFLLQIYVGVS